MSAHPKSGRVGDVVRIDYTVKNTGTVAVGRVELLDLDVKPVVPPIPLLEAGETKVVSQSIELTEADVPRREIRVEVSAATPFGRQATIGYESIYVRVSPE